MSTPAIRWVVVGGGTGGVVAASRLAERADHAVTLVEAGPGEPPAERGDSFFDALAVPGRTIDDLDAVRVDGRPPSPYRRGRGLGGSGAVNAMIALPGGAFGAPHRLHAELADPAELGAVDRALLAASADADRVPLTRRAGRRLTVTDHYPLDDVEVLGGQVVDRVLLDGARAVGVRLADGTEVPADRVVLSAGAIGSPTVLARSGVEVAGLGEGLKDHPSAPITLALRPDATADPASLAVGVMLRRGPYQILPLNHVGRDAPGYGVLMPALMHVRSEGRVRLHPDRPSDPGAPPLVELGMLRDRGDLTGLVAAVRLALELLDHPAFRRIVLAAYVDDVGTEVDRLDSDAAIAAWLPDHVGDYVHAACTCRMGVVVDDRGAVRDHEHLYVCDASVFPDLPEVNTNLPTVTLAETLVRRWLAL